jgi:competence protein ComEC
MVGKIGLTLTAAWWILSCTLPYIHRDVFMVNVLNVGQGNAVLVTSSSGHTLLYDGGPDGLVLSELGSVLPPWIRKIDAIALSHTHTDHIAGLTHVMRSFQVDRVLLSSHTTTSPLFLLFASTIPSATTQQHLSTGDHLDIGSMSITALTPFSCKATDTPAHPHDCNLLLHVSDPRGSVLLTGDFDARHLAPLMDQCRPPQCTLAADIFIAPHHGARGVTTPALLAAVSPQISIISVGIDNTYGHPHQDTLNALANHKTLRTDIHGRIAIICQQACFPYPQVQPP